MVSLNPLIKPRRRLRTRRDFANTSYRAPDSVRRLSHAYNEVPPTFWQRWGWKIIIALVVAGIGAVVFSPLFKIQNIIIDNTPTAETEQRMHDLIANQLTHNRLGVLPESNLLFFSTTETKQVIADQFFLRDLKFERHWPNVLRVTMPLDAIVAVWQTDKNSFLLDSQGIVVQTAPQPADPTSTLPAVHSINTTKPVALGDSVISGAGAVFIGQFANLWLQQIQKLNLDYLEVDKINLPTMRAFTDHGWYVNISSQEQATTQIEALKRLLEDKIKDDESKLDYIDVRFGSKLYYKLK